MNVKPLSTALKCFDLLDTIAAQPGSVRISELGRMLGESRATTYQRLLTLTAAGWLERLADGSYRLSTKACGIASSALKQAGFGDRAQPILDDLVDQFGETVSLVLLEQGKLVITQRAEGQGVLRADLQVGAELTYSDSSSGAVWLAFGPAELIEDLRESGVKLPTKKQIESVQIEKISIGGGGKSLPGISSIAVPIIDRTGVCVASLSISGPDARFSPTDYVPALRDAADRLAAMAPY